MYSTNPHGRSTWQTGTKTREVGAGVIIKEHGKFTGIFNGLPLTQEIVLKANSMCPFHSNPRQRKVRCGFRGAPSTSVRIRHYLPGS